MEFDSMLQPSTPQHQLSDFLHAELLHTLGSYKYASDKLANLLEEVGTETHAEMTLRKVARDAHRCNRHLHDLQHRPIERSEDPGKRRRYPSPHDAPPEKPQADLLPRIYDFYDAAAAALTLHRRALSEGNGKVPESPGCELGGYLAVVHDPHRREDVDREPKRSKKDRLAILDGRIDRTLHRRHEVDELLSESSEPRTKRAVSSRRSSDTRHFNEILGDHMGVQESFTALHLTILEALSDAHMWMHEAEHLRSQSFESMLTEIPETDAKMRQALRRSRILNTFVHVAGWGVPWVFAEDVEERNFVRRHYRECCDRLTPTYCMSIGTQLSLLALHRRAYTWWTLGERGSAYRDFYKLIRFLRELRPRVDQRADRPPGTKTLIEGLTAIAEHHIGRIYRGQHAHRVALRYFDRASSHLKGWESHDEIGNFLKNSRWRLNLLISQGKANYELGRVKKSLLYYARAWRAFLLLAESESHASANIKVIKELIDWLADVQDGPSLNKAELSRRLEPLVKQFESVHSPVHLRRLAADIMMRLGHLLFILKLPPEGWHRSLHDGALPPRPDHALARRCLTQAGILDPTSTLIGADLLKIRHRASPGAGKLERKPEMVNIQEQWPSGSGRFEETARIVEYILQTWLSDVSPKGSDEAAVRRRIARDLFGSFLAHTDSSNVKLAQVYRYLMQKPSGLKRDTPQESTTLDLICLRRYSSFFPFLPRPASFRSPGGGYLVQVREPGSKAEPFGIAIDPGPNFLDNLYRCGYALSDIHMILLTHDHADHIASLDALLALMGTRLFLGADTFGETKEGKKRCLAIVGNESVYERYRFFNDPHPIKRRKGKPVDRGDVVRVMRFEDFFKLSKLRDKDRRKKVEDAEILPPPDTLCVEPVRTLDHLDARAYPSQGFLLSVGRGASRSTILFTGDTGPPDEGTGGRPKHYFAAGTKSLTDAAAEADVVVAHLSSVPMRELRAFAGMANADDREAVQAFSEIWERARVQAEAKYEDRDWQKGAEETRFLLRQIQFGFRSRGEQLDDLTISPFSPLASIRGQSEKHLYLSGLLDLAEHMAENGSAERPPLLLIGELREELGTFRTRIAGHINETVFKRGGTAALTADIGLRVRLSKGGPRKRRGQTAAAILCTTCDLDNDLTAEERFHPPDDIREVCVKGENEGVFYNCMFHDPGQHADQLWIESVERYDPFGDWTEAAR